MSRKLSDMTEEERGAFRIWDSILKNDLSTPAEKERARKEIDALQWGGTTGPVMEKLCKLEARIEALEAKRSGSSKLSKKAQEGIVTDCIEAAKEAIQAEARAAAEAAVRDLGGDF